jgi:hypothetical protein
VRAVQVLVRPHPANTAVYDGLDACVWPRGTATGTRVPHAGESADDLFASILHAAATAGINTSAMIDAIVADRPCISVLTEQYRETQDEAAHFQHLRDSHAIVMARGAAEACERLASIMGGDDVTAPGRAAFVAAFVRPRGIDVPAGTQQAREVLDLARTGHPEQQGA